MSYRIAILPCVVAGVPVGANPDDGQFDDVIPEDANPDFIEAVAERWSRSPVGGPLRIYAPSAVDLRLGLLKAFLEDEYSYSEEMYQVVV